MVDSSNEVYAVVSLSGDPRSRQRVATDRSGGRNPTWNATVRFAVPANAASSVHVLLRAERALGDRDVGEVHIPLSELLSGAPDGSVPVKFVAYQSPPAAAAYPPQGAYPPVSKANSYAPPSAYPPAGNAYPPQSAYPQSAKADGSAAGAYPPPSGYPPAGKTGEPSTAYPAPAGYPPAGKTREPSTAYSAPAGYPTSSSGKPAKAGEPVTAYPAAAAGPSTAAPYGAPPPQYGYRYPPQQQLEVGQQQQRTHGYGYPPQQQLEVGQLELEVGED
ncbi:protein SRC2-like [Hordeum vulgare]|nr:protein SRC2-like [Hordeum vulgare]